MDRAKPDGTVTRGTTAPNRLRRCDRWLTGPQAWRLRTHDRPLVVDLGYGRTPVTAVELHRRLRAIAPRVQVVGIEIEPDRVAAATPLEHDGLRFVRGGFELPVDGEVSVVRAFNVLRQYDEAQVAPAWSRMRSRLSADGIAVDGTCDEIGRVASWVTLTRDGPVSLTVSLRLAGLIDPVVVAERLPKALIHHNVPGEPVHDFLAALSDAWRRASPHSSYGPRQQFVAAVGALRSAGWPLLDGPARWRLGELSVTWAAVAPNPRR